MYISSLIALLIFLFGNNISIFTYFNVDLRDGSTETAYKTCLKSVIINIYKEYNVPLPKN